MEITISTVVFAAASLFRGIDDIRYYLNGLYLETGAHGARLVGCDGPQLAVAKIEGAYPESSIILPGSLVAAVKAKAKGPQEVTLAFDEGHRRYVKKGNIEGIIVPRDITLTMGEITTTAKELDGKFPDYRRVVPDEVDGAPTQFAPYLLTRIDKACAILGNKTFTGVAYNGEKSALSVIAEHFVVITMPFKTDPLTKSPAWVKKSLHEPSPDRSVVGLAA